MHKRRNFSGFYPCATYRDHTQVVTTVILSSTNLPFNTQGFESMFKTSLKKDTWGYIFLINKCDRLFTSFRGKYSNTSG